VFGCIVEGEGCVFWSLSEAAVEVGETILKPWVVLREGVHAKGDELAGEEFGERRGDGFEEGAVGDEVDVGVDCVANAGENGAGADDVVAIETGGLCELQPFFDAACAGVAVMVDDSFAPCAAEGDVLGFREDDGVFDGDAALVVITI